MEALGSEMKALAANQEINPCLVAAVAQNWLSVGEANVNIHHHDLGVAGADISHHSHVDRALMNEVAGLCAETRSHPFVGVCA